MIALEHSVVIDRPLDEVFAFVTEVENAPLWQAWAVEAKLASNSPQAAGSQYTYVTSFLGRRFESAGEITTYEPNRKYGWRVKSGPVPAEAICTFEAVAGGTKLTMNGNAEAAGFFKLAEPIVGCMAKRQIAADLDNLKDLLEAGEGAV